jgi:hypothetical protein
VTEPQRRLISPGGIAARQHLTQLLANVWVAEAIRPGEFLVIASPVLSDCPALDNRGGEFSTWDSRWGERVLRLSELVLRVLSQGGSTWLITRRQADGPNRFLCRIRESAGEAGFAARLRTAEVDTLPAAGVFGVGYSVTGAIAFADSGPDFLGEAISFEFHPAVNSRSHVQDKFGGLLT